MNDSVETILMVGVGAYVFAGFVVAGLWAVTFLFAAGRRGGGGGAAPVGVTPGTGRVMLGALLGVGLGMVVGCGGLLLLVEIAGSNVDLPWQTSLLLLAIPVGLVAAPGLALWGTVLAWRAAERSPGDDPAAPAGPAAAAAPTDDGSAALDAPFDPPPAGGGGG